MKNLFIVFIISGIIFISCKTEEPSSPALSFNEYGKFKIAQFTDIHFKYNSPRSDSALVLMEAVIEKEKPDLIVLTGDIVCSKETAKAWNSLSEVFIKAKIPWAVTLGNHDDEYELSRTQIIEHISGMPYSLTIDGPADISGKGNYILEISSSGSSETMAVLYFLDSNAYPDKREIMGKYDWIKFDQIQWYRDQSLTYTQANNNKPLPALAFFHIPFPEYKEIIGKENTFGVQEETVCAPDINTGMYAAMLESGDVMGTFVGHDHDNNYIGVLTDICLDYGAVTGIECYGKIGRGARVIELIEGERKFNTWLYYPDNTRKYSVTYPDSFKEN